MFGKSVSKDSTSCDNVSFFDSYIIEEKLSCNGNSSVYFAWHKRLHKHVVIKEVVSCNSDSTRINRNEVEALKNLKCASIPQVLDFFIESDRTLTILEYIPGESFDKLIQKGITFNADQLSKWFYTLASSLVTIHNHDICHRDIKPANIILSPLDDVHLIDFDSALVKNNHTGIISCTLAYASPEQYKYFNFCAKAHKKDKFFASKRKVVDNSSVLGYIIDEAAGKSATLYSSAKNIDWKLSDIYSLGATMYHLYFGVRPPSDTQENSVFPRVNHHSSPISDIIERCMKANPKERFSSAQELRNALP